ncbi:MAG: hypothetical protein OEZ10_03995 [Gammaproteobacteria bacterium]|nr:hypothetical protein [Gammaproteobacteria bacterium]
MIQQVLAMGNRPIPQGVVRVSGAAWINEQPARPGTMKRLAIYIRITLTAW